MLLYENKSIFVRDKSDNVRFYTMRRKNAMPIVDYGLIINYHSKLFSKSNHTNFDNSLHNNE